MEEKRTVTNEYGVVIDYKVAENLMDAELREKIAYELQLVSDQEFLIFTVKNMKESLERNGSFLRKTRAINYETYMFEMWKSLSRRH